MRMRLTAVVIFLVLSGLISAFIMQSESNSPEDEVTLITESKIDGISLEAPSRECEIEVFQDLKEIHAEWVCLMPYAYTPRNSPEIRFEHGHQWWGERKEGIVECIQMAHDKGLKVMIKPHLWIDWGSFTGDLSFQNESDWQKWENDYRDYVMLYVELAEKHNVEMLCIGTELKTFVRERKSFWNSFIAEIKNVYEGKLTYAGNWDSYKDVYFWKEMDYIGVDAYFPLSDKKDPDVGDLSDGWKKWKKEMKRISETNNKPVIFTEFGYCSTDYACREPWKEEKHELNYRLQSKAYQSLFEEFWKEDWFAGGFMWKWHTPDHLARKSKHTFTPQDKPALEVLKDGFR